MPPKPRAKRQTSGSEFAKWFRPLVECLRELGSAKPREAADWIAEKERLPASFREAVNKNGGERFLNQVCFARQYLLWEGIIDGSNRGIWTLTSQGMKARLTDEEAQNIVTKWTRHWTSLRRQTDKASQLHNDHPQAESDDNPLIQEENKESDLLETLRCLSPKGFEHFCRHLLLVHGFENVNVTGRSGDGGIDGEGILQINPFVSSVVVFQCKRYTRSVSREEVSRLRGDAGGRGDKAILLTTGTFTAPARQEAARTTPRVELIDGEQIVAMCEEKGIGLKPRTVYDLDPQFFEQFGD